MNQIYDDEHSIFLSRQAWIQRVFIWMFLGLSMTAIIAYILNQNRKLMQYVLQNEAFLFGILITHLVIAISLYFLFILNRLTLFAATLGFFLYAALNGISLPLILAFFEITIYTSFFVLASMFGLCAVIGYITKIDLTRISSIAIMLILGALLASVFHLCWSKHITNLIISYTLVVLFCIITAYCVQKMEQVSEIVYNETLISKPPIFGALEIYIGGFAGLFFKNIT